MFKKNWLLAVFALFLLLFFLLFPRKSGPEMVLDFLNETILSEEILQSRITDDETGWLYSKNFTLSIDHDGAISRVLNRDGKTTLTHRQMVRAVSPGWELWTAGKEFPLSLDTPDPLFILSDRLFSYGPYNQVSERSTEGELLWTQQIPATLTAYDADQSSVVLGCLNGMIQILDSTGKLLQEYRPGGSRIEAVYAVALGEEGRYIGLLSGLNPQRLVILEKKSEDYLPVFHQNMETQFRGPVRMSYSEEGRFFALEDIQGVTLVHIEEFTLERLETKGRLKKVVYPKGLENPLVLVDLGDRFQLSSFLDGRPVYRQEFNADFADLYTQDDKIVLVLDNRVIELAWRFL